MKKLFLLNIVSLLLISCGGERSTKDIIEDGDLSEMRTKKSELVNQQTELRAQIDSLTEAIEKKSPKRRGALVTTKTLQDTTFKHYFEVQGNVETDQNIVIYPEFTGVLTQIYVEEGEEVRKGQRLAKIDDGGLSSQLARQESQTALAKTTFERQKRLWDQNIGSEISYLEAKSNYDAMKAASDQLKSQLGKTILTAPFSGVVDNIISEVGQVVNAGQSQVIRLVNLSDMYVNASVPESYLGDVSVGTDVIIELSSLGEEIVGKVRQVGNFVSPDNRTFDIKVGIPNPDNKVKPNLIATVKINDYTAENAITIPESIIQQNANGNSITYIYQAETDSTGIAKQVKIEQGYTDGQLVEVTEGLKAGDQVIVEGVRTLRDGQQVEIKENTEN